ncbi:unnamed protein product [Rhizopus stolonifer]
MLSAAAAEELQELTLARDGLLEEVKLTIISHPYLDDMMNKIRKEHIPWDEYKDIGLISEDEMAMIKYVENKSVQELVPIMTEHGQYYAILYLELMQKLARVDALQKVLVLIHDMLNEHEERIYLFHKAKKNCSEFPFTPFYKVLGINDEFIGIQSSKLLTLLICSTPHRDIDICDFFVGLHSNFKVVNNTLSIFIFKYSMPYFMYQNTEAPFGKHLTLLTL